MMLSGQRLYLDLPDKALARRLEAEIEYHGGKVERFLSKDVSCVVTNKDHKQINCSRQTSAKACTAAGNKAAGSPCLSRGMALLMKSKKRTELGEGGQDPLQFANKWGIACLQMNEFLKQNKIRLGCRTENQNGPASDAEVSRSRDKMMKVKRLAGPCLKFEDFGRLYKPQVHTFTYFPHITDLHKFHQNPNKEDDKKQQNDSCIEGRENQPCPKPRMEKDCPQEKKVITKKNEVKDSNGVSKKAKKAEGKKTHKELVKNKDKVVKEQSKSGYCESCDIFFDSLSDHVASQSHQDFALNKENFATLDEAISFLPGIDDLLNTVAKDVVESSDVSTDNVDALETEAQGPKAKTGENVKSVGEEPARSSPNSKENKTDIVCDRSLATPHNKVLTERSANVGLSVSAERSPSQVTTQSPSQMASKKIEPLMVYEPITSPTKSAEHSNNVGVKCESESVKYKCSCVHTCSCKPSDIGKDSVEMDVPAQTVKVEDLKRSPCYSKSVHDTKHFDVDAFIKGSSEVHSKSSVQTGMQDINDNGFEQMDFDLGSGENLPSSWIASFPDPVKVASDNPGKVWSSAASVHSGWDLQLDRVCNHVLDILDCSESNDSCQSSRVPLQELCCYNRTSELADSNSVSPDGTAADTKATSLTQHKPAAQDLTFHNAMQNFKTSSILPSPAAKLQETPAKEAGFQTLDKESESKSTVNTRAKEDLIDTSVCLGEQSLCLPGSLSPASIPDVSTWDIQTPPGECRGNSQDDSVANLFTPPHVSMEEDEDTLLAAPVKFELLSSLNVAHRTVSEQTQESQLCQGTTETPDESTQCPENLMQDIVDEINGKCNTDDVKSEVKDNEEDDLANMSLPMDIVNNNLNSILHALNSSAISCEQKPNCDSDGESQDREKELCKPPVKASVGHSHSDAPLVSTDSVYPVSSRGIRLKINLKDSTCTTTSCDESTDGASSESEIDVVTCSPLKKPGRNCARDKLLPLARENRQSAAHNRHYAPQHTPSYWDDVNIDGLESSWTVASKSSGLKLCLRRVVSTPKSKRLADQSQLQWQVKRSGDCKVTLSASKDTKSHKRQRQAAKTDRLGNGNKSKRRKLHL